MLEGKKYPQNVRALRLLTEQLLHPITENNELNNMADLENLLADLSTKSRTTKAWTELVIKPVLLSMQFTRATHEPDYALLFTTMNKMLPYFFAAHKHNYARYGTFFCRSLTWLPSEVEQQFLRGEQILQSASHGRAVEWYSFRPVHRNHMDEARKGSQWCNWKHTKPTDSGNVVVQPTCGRDTDGGPKHDD